MRIVKYGEERIEFVPSLRMYQIKRKNGNFDFVNEAKIILPGGDKVIFAKQGGVFETSYQTLRNYGDAVSELIDLMRV